MQNEERGLRGITWKCSPTEETDGDGRILKRGGGGRAPGGQIADDLGIKGLG
jgi:hypothetical protein